MKKISVYLAGATLAGAAACTFSVVVVAAAATWDLYASYPTPGPNPRGYTSEDEFTGYIVQDGPTPYVYRMYWYSSKVLASFPAPGGAGAWGICRGPGSNLFLSNGTTSWIYKITTTGSVVSSFRCPLAGPADLDRGFGSKLYVPIPGRNVIAVLDENTGSLVSTFSGPGSRPTACGGYPGEFFVADSATHAVYEEGKPVITAIRTPTGFGNIALMVDGSVAGIYVADDATNYIYFYRNASPVAPASLGRVKALFR
jgi:hypothetical protein